MPASYPKPDNERRNRAAPAFGWVYLAPRHRVVAPTLPTDREWLPETQAWWSSLWARPQAVMWDPTGITLFGLARLYQASIAAEEVRPAVHAEMRAIEDRHGLSPKALLQLRWRIADPGDLVEQTPNAGTTSTVSTAERRRLLRLMGSS